MMLFFPSGEQIVSRQGKGSAASHQDRHFIFYAWALAITAVPIGAERIPNFLPFRSSSVSQLTLSTRP
jgi:hypothetical protein